MQKNERKIIEKYSAKAKRHLKYDEKGTGSSGRKNFANKWISSIKKFVRREKEIEKKISSYCCCRSCIIESEEKRPIFMPFFRFLLLREDEQASSTQKEKHWKDDE